MASVVFVEAFEKREGELANRAGNLEECGDYGAAFHEGGERVFLVVEGFERKSGSDIPGNDVGHVILSPLSARRENRPG
jgi:hypothetical protein